MRCCFREKDLVQPSCGQTGEESHRSLLLSQLQEGGGDGGDGHQLRLNLKMAPIRLKTGSSSEFGALMTNPVSVSGLDLSGDGGDGGDGHQLRLNLKMAPIRLKTRYQ